MTYDHWKTTEPDSDEEPPPEKPVFTESDVDRIMAELRTENARVKAELAQLQAALQPTSECDQAYIAAFFRARAALGTAQRYVIAWRSRLTGVTDSTTSAFTHAEAEKICQSMNRQNHTVYHWPKEVAEDRSKPALTPSANGA